jgi:hypothetical protein
MKPTILAAATCLLAGAAWADGEELQSCTRLEDTTVQCPVNLTKGRDYILRRQGDYGSGCVEMVNPQGTPFGTMCGYSDSSEGFEFRAGQTGTFWIRSSSEDDPSDEGPSGSLYTDCRNANNTQCRLLLTGDVKGGHAGHNDRDRWKTASLRKGRTYTLTLSSQNYTEVSATTATGKRLGGGHVSFGTTTFRFRAPANGSLYIRTYKGGPYTLQLR